MSTMKMVELFQYKNDYSIQLVYHEGDNNEQTEKLLDDMDQGY